MASKSVAAVQTNLPAVSEEGFEEFAGQGLENVGVDDVLVPRLAILQNLSPQINKKKAEYIEGAEVGSIADVGTGEIFPDGVIFLPVYYRKDYLEWAPRSSGKGLVAVHSGAAILERTTRNERNQPVLSNGNYIAETAQWFGLNLTADRRKCYVPMTSTQLKKSRKWMTLATGEKLKRTDGSEYLAPLFFRSYKLTTGTESNNDGEWAGWIISRYLSLPELGAEIGFDWRSVKDEAVAFRESLAKGEMRADVESPETSDAM